MQLYLFLIVCAGSFFVGMLVGILVVRGVKLKNLSLKKKYEFHEPVSLKQSDILLSDEVMKPPIQDTVDGHNALQEWQHGSAKFPD